MQHSGEVREPGAAKIDQEWAGDPLQASDQAPRLLQEYKGLHPHGATRQLYVYSWVGGSEPS